jgi:hypothetical protein
MPAVRFIGAVFGSALYGALLGVGLFAIYALRGASGSTGMEILVLPLLTLEATVAGTAAAVISLVVPRTSLRSSDNFLVLVGAAFLLQASISLLPFLMSQGYLQHNMVKWAIMMSGPVDWTKSGLKLELALHRSSDARDLLPLVPLAI